MKIILVFLFLLTFSGQIFSQIQFLPWQNFLVGSKAQAVAIGDLNHDGLNDVAITTGEYFDPTNDYSLMVFYQNTTGQLVNGFQAHYPISYNQSAESIAIGD